MAKQMKAPSKEEDLENWLQAITKSPKYIEAINRMLENRKNKPQEYIQVFESMVNYLKAEGHVLPVSIHHFASWWAYEKNGHKGTVQLFATKITQEDLVEYSLFKKRIFNKEIKPPFWYSEEEDLWVF